MAVVLNVTKFDSQDHAIIPPHYLASLILRIYDSP